MKELVIVESPAKARTINAYLGPNFTVMASMGHVRDLPDKNPKGVKDPVPGVDIENGFKPTYEILKGRSKTVSELKRAARNASGIWLATDLDREGEAIAWHLTEALNARPDDVNRVVFNAITKSEIEKAFQHPHPIDMDKVNAQQARRILDRIVGYQVSPLLWRKIAGGLSAGRVQSVAVRLIVEREREIEDFRPEEYWRLTGYFTPDLNNASALKEQWTEWLAEAPRKREGGQSDGRTIREKNGWLAEHNALAAELIELDGKKFEAGDMGTALEAAKRAGFQLQEKIESEPPQAKEQPLGRGPAPWTIRLTGRLEEGPPWRVKSIQDKRTKGRPSPPFITSTLQQAGANQLDFSAQTTMRLAQDLYEGMPIAGVGSVGLITYMRTDSTQLSGEAVSMVRKYISSQFGDKYLPAGPNSFVSSNKKAQEAHEAIRPTDVTLTPDRVRASLDDRHFKLYKIIWERFVACQMSDAEWDSRTVLISGGSNGGELVFRASGRVLIFDGHYRVSGMPNLADEAVLPQMSGEQPLAALQIDPAQNFTSPPPRYTEASLIKKLEAEGIGRPSTYAQIIQVIQSRKYVEKIRNRFHATDLGKVVTDKLIGAFPEILEVGYTRDMEQRLDDIEEKHADWVDMLKDFYGKFSKSLDAAYEGMRHAKAETEPAPYICPECRSETVYRFGRRGRFLSCSRYPDCKYAAPVDREGRPAGPEKTEVACPVCKSPMLLRQGRFGPFLSCERYPDCKSIVNLDGQGRIIPPKVPPLRTDLLCPKCQEPLNLRRGGRGLWLGCSKFPKCRGRLGWVALKAEEKARWEKALQEHEKNHPLMAIRRLDGAPLGKDYQIHTGESGALDVVEDQESAP